MINIVIIIQMILIVFLLVLFIINFIQKRKLRKEIYEIKKENTKIKSVFSMTEYHIRKFKEGINPYTVISRIIDLYRDNL